MFIVKDLHNTVDKICPCGRAKKKDYRRRAPYRAQPMIPARIAHHPQRPAAFVGVGAGVVLVGDWTVSTGVAIVVETVVVGFVVTTVVGFIVIFVVC
jgi:hypothetical protein